MASEATPSTVNESPPIDGSTQNSLKRASIGRPETKVRADGTICKMAMIDKVLATTVPCDKGGETLPKDADFTHYKTTFSRLVVAEMRNIEREYVPCQASLSAQLVRELVVQVGAEVRDVSGLVLVVEKELLSFPQAVSLSFDYTSPQGGEWYVEGHPLVLSDKPESASGCCTLQ